MYSKFCSRLSIYEFTFRLVSMKILPSYSYTSFVCLNFLICDGRQFKFYIKYKLLHILYFDLFFILFTHHLIIRGPVNSHTVVFFVISNFNWWTPWTAWLYNYCLHIYYYTLCLLNFVIWPYLFEFYYWQSAVLSSCGGHDCFTVFSPASKRDIMSEEWAAKCGG